MRPRCRAAIGDLMTVAALERWAAQWKTIEAKMHRVLSRDTDGPGPATPHGSDIESACRRGQLRLSKWPTIEPKDLASRTGGGGSFIWYQH